MTKKVIPRTSQAGVPLTGRYSAGMVALQLVLLAVITYMVYANAWPNTLIFDDKLFVDYHSFSYFSAIPGYFVEDVWAAKSLSSGLYRPLLFASVTVDANIFRDWFAGYHLVNVLLHVVLTLLVYAFVARLLEMDDTTRTGSAYIAFLAALVFGIHPMHTEVVNSIFNRSVLLEGLGTVTGLWWLLHYLESKPILAWSGIFLAYLCALFCRETAVVLPGLAAVLVLIYSHGNIPARVRKCLPVLFLLIPMVFYLVLRDRALSTSETGPTRPETSVASVVAQVDSSRLLDANNVVAVAGTWVEAFAVMIWPFTPKISYDRSPHVLQFFGVFVHLGLLALAIFQFRRGHAGLLAGLTFFYIAMLPSSHLFGTGEFIPTLAERYLYMPSVGLTVLLAYGLSYLNRRFDRFLAAAPVLLVLFIWSPVTWARNAQWTSEIALFESDYSHGVDNGYLLRLITGAQLRAKNFNRVMEICDDHRAEQSLSGMFASHCGTAYSYSRRPEDAERAYLEGTKHDGSSRLAHSNLAQHYMRHGRWNEAKIQFEKSVEAEQDPALKAYYTGYMLVHLYTNDSEKLQEARGYFEEALRLQPRLDSAQTWLNEVNRALGEAPESE